jgi:hypothetical protein
MVDLIRLERMSVRPAVDIPVDTSSIVVGGAAAEPPLHSRLRSPTNENDIYYSNQTMDPLTKNQQGSLDEGNNRVAPVEYDDDDDFMMRFVDGTCRGIFSTDDEGDIEKLSLCHLPSCNLGERLDVLLVRFTDICFSRYFVT